MAGVVALTQTIFTTIDNDLDSTLLLFINETVPHIMTQCLLLKYVPGLLSVCGERANRVKSVGVHCNKRQIKHPILNPHTRA